MHPSAKDGQRPLAPAEFRALLRRHLAELFEELRLSRPPHRAQARPIMADGIASLSPTRPGSSPQPSMAGSRAIRSRLPSRRICPACC